MAQRPSNSTVTGGLETGRLGGRVRPGSQAAYRKAFTQSARASMEEIIQRYSRLINKLRVSTPDILQEALEPVFVKSQEYCPVDRGYLKQSGKITITTSGKTVRANINYGGPGTPYAAIVHERMDLHHKPPTRAKFLQSAMEEELGTVMINLTALYAVEVRGA